MQRSRINDHAYQFVVSPTHDEDGKSIGERGITQTITGGKCLLPSCDMKDVLDDFDLVQSVGLGHDNCDQFGKHLAPCRSRSAQDGDRLIHRDRYGHARGLQFSPFDVGIRISAFIEQRIEPEMML